MVNVLGRRSRAVRAFAVMGHEKTVKTVKKEKIWQA